MTGDAFAGLSSLRSLVGNRELEDSLSKSIAKALEEKLRESDIGEADEADFRAAVLDAEALLADLRSDDAAILQATLDESGFYSYLAAGKASPLLRASSASTTPFLESILRLSSEQFALNVRNEPRFLSSLLVETYRKAGDLEAAVASLAADFRAQHAKLSPSEISEAILTTSELVRTDLEPGTLTPIGRTQLIQASLNSAFPQAFLGAGGLGKSVLAGQLYDAHKTTRSCILLSVGRIPGHGRLDTPEELDVAFGRAATTSAIPLTEATASLEVRPIVILDTLDLALRGDSAVAVTTFLDRLAIHADIILTCRDSEWDDMVERNWTTQLAVRQRMPQLSRDESLLWISTFLDSATLPPPVRATFLASVQTALRQPHSEDVLGVPLRLAMACDIYAPFGHIPEDLTATLLYDAYWKARVETDRNGHRSLEADQVQATALLIAREVWRESDHRFVQDVAPPEDTDFGAISRLRSERVLARHGRRYQFFHQTFAEFAVARYLAVHGRDDDWDRLRLGLDGRVSGYWAIAGHLLSEELSSYRLEEILEAVPRTRIEGARLILTTLFARPATQYGSDVLIDLTLYHPNQLAASADILGSAPDTFERESASALIQLLSKTETDLTSVVRALAAHAVRAEDALQAQYLDSVLDAMVRRAHAGDDGAPADTWRFIDRLGQDQLGAEALATAVRWYARIPDAGKYAICTLFAHQNRSTVSSAFLSEALAIPVPDKAVDDCLTIAKSEWLDETARHNRGWTSWLAIIALDLPKRWDAVQVRLAAYAVAQNHQLDNLLHEGLRPRDTSALRERVINTVRFIADHQPKETLAALLRIGVEPDKVAVSTASQLALQLQPHLADDERYSIVALLAPLAQHSPRRAWPAVLKLSASDPTTLSGSLYLLRNAIRLTGPSADWNVTVSSSLDALLQVCHGNALVPHLAAIEDVLVEAGGVPIATRAKVLAAVAPTTETARLETDAIFDSHQTDAQADASRMLGQCRSDWTATDWRSFGLAWTVSLLRVRHAGSVMTLAKNLEDEAMSLAWTQDMTDTVVTRLLTALEESEDPQVSRNLFVLVGNTAHRTDGRSAPTPEQAHAIVQRYRDKALAANVTTANRDAALYAQYSRSISHVAKALLPFADVVNLAREQLATVDTEPLGNGAVRSLASTLTSMLRSDASTWGLFEGDFGQAPVANRQAVAEALFSRYVPDAIRIGERLARRQDCPEEVTGYINRKILRITQSL